MKRSVIIAIVLFFSASAVFAQVGTIDIFADQNATDCNIVDAVPADLEIYIFHTYSSGSSASQWKLDLSEGAEYLWDHYVGEYRPFPAVIGNTRDGIAIGYGSCLTGTFLLARVTFAAQGLTPTCGLMSIVPHPDALTGSVEFVDCNLTKFVFDSGGRARVNADETCRCNVPVHESTWGQIKSLYR